MGAIKIKDGLFIGDDFAAQDLEFVVANKVTRVINCSGAPNHWEPIGVGYLNVPWNDTDDQVLFDESGNSADILFSFIEEALERLESVLVHSGKGQSRSSSVIAAYMMRKYKWSLLKTLEFLNSRRPDLEIRASFIHQLSAYETSLVSQGLISREVANVHWDEIKNHRVCRYENEELLLRNTFLNS